MLPCDGSVHKQQSAMSCLNKAPATVMTTSRLRAQQQHLSIAAMAPLMHSSVGKGLQSHQTTALSVNDGVLFIHHKRMMISEKNYHKETTIVVNHAVAGAWPSTSSSTSNFSQLQTQRKF